MSLSRHPRTLIDILRRREGENAQAALLADDPAIVSGANQGTSTTGGAVPAAQAIEARSGDPAGADLYEAGSDFWTATSESTHSFVLLKLREKTLTATAYRPDGSTLDTFSITKP